MKKVLHIFTYSSNNIGGVSTMIESYIHGVKEFSSNGFSLDVLNIPLNFNLHFSKLNNIAYIFVQRKAVKKHLKANRYDIVHIHTSREFLFLKDLLLAKMINKKTKIPVVITIHVGAMDTVFNSIGWFKKKAISIMNKYIEKTIFLSKIMRDEFYSSGLMTERGMILYNFHNFTPTVCVEKNESKALQLLFVGMLNRDKGIIELLTALSQLPEFDYHLNICGKLVDKSIEAELEELKTKLSNKVSFLGYVVGEDKTKLFYNSDILVLPSYHEGMPIVIMEALAAGCAIITTKVGAIPEVLSDDNCSWVKIGSVEDIVNTLKSITPEALSVQQVRNKILGKDYSFVEHVQKLSKIYNSL